MTDCPGFEDEEYCDNFTNLINPSKFCASIPSIYVSNYSWECPVAVQKDHSYESCIIPLDNYNTLTLDFTGLDQFRKTNYEMETNIHCLFEPNKCYSRARPGNGEHLLSCENHTCSHEYFKCPGFYCLPWRFVCSGQWECPGGTDEMNCHQRSCPGMFRCKNSTICITKISICDSVSDCHLEDDEHFCEQIPHPCPANC